MPLSRWQNWPSTFNNDSCFSPDHRPPSPQSAESETFKGRVRRCSQESSSAQSRVNAPFWDLCVEKQQSRVVASFLHPQIDASAAALASAKGLHEACLPCWFCSTSTPTPSPLPLLPHRHHHRRDSASGVPTTSLHSPSMTRGVLIYSHSTDTT